MEGGNSEGLLAGAVKARQRPLRHVGMYGFRRSLLNKWPTLAPSFLQVCHGIHIRYTDLFRRLLPPRRSFRQFARVVSAHVPSSVECVRDQETHLLRVTAHMRSGNCF